MTRRAPYVHPSALVEPGARLGDGTRCWAQVQVRAGATVGSDCILGKGAFVDVDVRIGSRCKLENYANVFRGAVVEDAVFLGPMAVLTNDRFPRATTPEGELKSDEDWTATGVTVRRGASVGAGAVVLPGVEVGAWALVAAGAVVTRDVPAHRAVRGNPARPFGWAGRCGHVVSDSDWSQLGECPTCQAPLR